MLTRSQTKAKPQEKNKAYRELNGSIRAAGGDGDRSFILSFSSEEPYDRWYGPEILDHSDGCVDLDRINEIGCLLFNHKRDYVIGKIKRAWIENGRGQAEIEFDNDDTSEVIYQKVKSGTLKGVSVGYMVDSWEEVAPGKTSADNRFTGPCSIARKWMPYEISIVSVPADATVGVGRSEQPEEEPVGPENPPDFEKDLESFERQLQINKNYMKMEEKIL